MRASSATAALSEFVARTRYKDLTQRVRDAARASLLDTVACGLYGLRSPEPPFVIRLARDLSRKREAVIWGTSYTSAAAHAALANGTLAAASMMDDTHAAAFVHPGSVVVPAALAVADRLKQVPGDRLLAGLAVGYEAAIRVGLSVSPEMRVRGFRPAALCGVFGAAAAAASLLELSSTKTIHALTIAGCLGSTGLMAAQYDAMVQRLDNGKAAQTGVMAALLAESGFTGPTNLLEANYGGFCRSFVSRPRLARVTHQLGLKWELLSTSRRPYPCASSTYSAIEAVRRIIDGHKLASPHVRRVTIRASKSLTHHCGWKYRPGSSMTAGMNIPYVVAVTILKGEPHAEHFRDDYLNAPEVLELAKRVSVIHDPRLDRLGDGSYRVHAEIVSDIGQYFRETANFGKGMPEHPMTPEEIVAKFVRLAGEVLPSDRLIAVREFVRNIESENAGSLGKLLRT